MALIALASIAEARFVNPEGSGFDKFLSGAPCKAPRPCIYCTCFSKVPPPSNSKKQSLFSHSFRTAYSKGNGLNRKKPIFAFCSESQFLQRSTLLESEMLDKGSPPLCEDLSTSFQCQAVHKKVTILNQTVQFDCCSWEQGISAGYCANSTLISWGNSCNTNVKSN